MVSPAIKKMLIVMCFANLCPCFVDLYRYYYDDYLKFSKFQIGIVDSMESAGIMLSSWVYYKYCKKSNLIRVFVLTLLFLFSAKLFLIPGIIDGVIGSRNGRFGMVSFQNLNQYFFWEFNLNPLFTLWLKECPDHFVATSITVLIGLVNFYYLLATGLASLIVWLLGFGKKNYSKIWVPVLIENSFLILALIVVVLVGLLKPEFFDSFDGPKSIQNNVQEYVQFEETELVHADKEANGLNQKPNEGCSI